MSQYPPSPYQSPQPGYQSPYGYDPRYTDPAAPCRRAAVLMFVIGGLAALFGFCVSAAITMIPPDQFATQMANNPGLPKEVEPELYRKVMIGAGVFIAVVGLVYCVFGAFVRRGSRVAIIISLVLTFLVLAFLAYNVLQGVMMAAQVPMAGVSVCITLLPTALTAWLLVWLFQANGAAGRMASWQGQYGAYPGHPQQQGYYPGQYPQQPQPPPGWGQPPPQGQWPPPPPPPQQQNWPPPQNPG